MAARENTLVAFILVLCSLGFVVLERLAGLASRARLETEKSFGAWEFESPSFR